MSWNKPLPQPTPISAPFWIGLKAHQVRLQRCEDCGQWIFFPRAHCPECASPKLVWRDVSGEGELYTYTIARIPTLPEFTDEMPQILAVVQFDQGPHINTTLIGVQESDLRIGMRVRPVFDDRPGEVTLLRYTSIESQHSAVIAAEQQSSSQSTAELVSQVSRRKISCKDITAMTSLVSEAFSEWSNEYLVTQEIIDEFAALSGDDYWIHTDPAKAREQSPFGTTIAHGMLVHALISRLKMPMDFEIIDFNNMVNYGSDRLRFSAPVPSGCRIHARYRVKAVESVRSGVQMTMEINVHVVGQDRPSVINDQVILYM